MVVDGLVASAGTCQRLHLVSQHTAHTHRVHLEQFREHRAKLARHVFPVLLHLADEVFARQQRVETCIDSRVDIGRQVLRQVVNALRHQVLVQLVKDVPDGLVHGVTLQQRVDKFVAHRYQLLRILAFKQQEYLILDFQVGKGQLCRTVLILRRGHQLVDVLLQMKLCGKVPEESKKGSHR